MSEWITDRLPTKEDADGNFIVWLAGSNGEVMRCHYEDIQNGEVWAPKRPPKPYVKPEPKRWKPKDGNGYYVIRSSGIVVYTISHDTLSNECTYNFGNCFQTKEQAIEAARRVRETLRNFHKELMQ